MTTVPSPTTPTIEEIVEARAKIGETPWQVGGRYWKKYEVTCDDGAHFVADCGDNIMSERIAAFIANTPRYIDLLLAELEKRDEEIERLRAENAQMKQDLKYTPVTDPFRD